MSTLFQKIKIPLIALIIIIVLFFGYEHFFGGSSPAPDALISSNATAQATTPADQNFLTMLLQIQNINFNEAVFSNPSFQSLQDDGQPLVEEPQGRPNPFAPIGTDSGSVVVVGTSTAASSSSQ